MLAGTPSVARSAGRLAPALRSGTHVIDRDARWAANFHGIRFDSVNMVLYVNGLINNAHAPSKPADNSVWEKIRSLF